MGEGVQEISNRSKEKGKREGSQIREWKAEKKWQ